MTRKEETPTDWVFCTLVDVGGLIFPDDPFSIGAYEFTGRPDPMAGCEEALGESATAYSLQIGEGILRAKTFFMKTSARDARRSGFLSLQETMDLFTQFNFGFAKMRIMDAGYLFDLQSGDAQPLLPKGQHVAAKMAGTTAFMDDRASNSSLLLNSLLSVHPRYYGELGQALRRCTHWARLAKTAFDQAERILLYWMACETLTRAREYESLTPKLVAASGFPYSKYFMSLPESERMKLVKIEGYKKWQSELKRTFETLREARNHIAHMGYREIELGNFFSDDELLALMRIFPIAFAKLRSMTMWALVLGMRSIEQMWDRYSDCIVAPDQPALAAWVSGTVIYTLEEKDSIFDD